jgi:Ca-activated chloride channel family protein
VGPLAPGNRSSVGRGQAKFIIGCDFHTGVKYYYGASLSQLDDAFQKISDELRAQYLLAYYPSQRRSASQYRRIQVGVSGASEPARYHVRHRAGYYTR